MPALRTDGQNAFETQLTAQMGPNDLTAQVGGIGALSSPCYLVIDYDNDAKREIILFDGSFTGTTFTTSGIGNRYLEGSAAGSNITHDIGAKVISSPVSQQISDLHDRLDSVDHGSLSGLSDNDHPQYVQKSGDTMTGQLVLAADPGSSMEAATKQYVDSSSVGIFVDGPNSGEMPNLANIPNTSRNTVGEFDVVIPSGWTTFWVLFDVILYHDPVGYANGEYYIDLQRSDDVKVMTHQISYNHNHSEPRITTLMHNNPNGEPLYSAADFLGDRILRTHVAVRELNRGGAGDVSCNAWRVQLIKVS